MQDPVLSAAYAQCEAIHRKYDPSFYAGCLMLPPAKRPYIDSLYAHARLLDQIVDDPDVPDVAAKEERLDARIAAYEGLTSTDQAVALATEEVEGCAPDESIVILIEPRSA